MFDGFADLENVTLSRIILSILLLGVTSIAAFAQSAEPRHPRTVVDYYMLLPEKYFEANREQRLHWMLDPERGAIIDIPNGYLFAPGDGAQTDIYTCIFKRSNGSYLVAVGYNDKDGVFETFLDFFLYDHGRLRNVTQTVLPVRFNKSLYYDLPRRGTTIPVTNASGKKLYDLVWTGNVFHLKRTL
jgi:hypothetical protein